MSVPWMLSFQNPKTRGKKRAAPAFLSLLTYNIQTSVCPAGVVPSPVIEALFWCDIDRGQFVVLINMMLLAKNSSTSTCPRFTVPLHGLDIGGCTKGSTAISRPGGYKVYRLASNMPKSQKKNLQAAASKIFVTSPK